MTKPSLLAGAVLVTLPLFALVPGCGGGSTGGIAPTATPATATPVGTATPMPTGTQGNLQSSKFYLANGQKGILNFDGSLTSVTATIEMLDSRVTVEGFKTRALSTNITPGIYDVTGTLFPSSRFFNFTATRANSTSFRMAGNLPTSGQRGSYSLSRGEGASAESESGTLLRIGEEFPTSVPRPTPTSVPLDTGRANLTFQASSDSNFVKDQPYYADINPGGSKQNVSLSFVSSGGRARLSGKVQQAVVGKSYGPTSTDILTLPSIENTVGDETRLFTFQGGTIKITVLEKASAQFTFENAVFAPKIGGGAGGATGTVTINGTIGSLINGDFIP